MTGYPLLVAGGIDAAWERDAPAVRDASLRVDEHEIVTVFGANGAGKTTLVAAISGLVPHVTGRISFAGEDILGLAPHAIAARGLVHAPAGRRVFADQTVEENLLVGAHAYRRDRARVRRSLTGMLERFEPLARRRRQPAGTLSGGEQQLLSIARALMGRPRLLVLDEPSLGLAPATADTVFAAVADAHDEGVAVLMIEKLVRVAVALSDRLYVMALGRIALEGPASELAGDPRIEAAYLGPAPGGDEPDDSPQS